MERDLSVIRKKRALREGVKLPLPAPSPINVLKDSANVNQEFEDVQIVADADLPMLDADVMTSQLQGMVDTNQPQGPSQMSGDDTMTADQVIPQDAAQTAGLAIMLPEEPKADEKNASKTADGASQNTGTKMEEIMATTNEQEQPAETNGVDFDFESMFNDTDFAAADGTINFDVDLSNPGPEAGQGQDILVDNAFENLAATGTDLANAAPATNEDITGLLDDVFNQAGDVTDAGANAATTAPEPPKQNEDPSQATSQPAASGTVPSQFDELFGTDTFDLGGNDEVIGDGNLGDFDFDEEWLMM